MTANSRDFRASRPARAAAWLPDAHLDPHPRRTWLLEHCFDLGVRCLFRRVELIDEEYVLEPGTLVVSNHKRDTDVPIIASALCQREGLRIRWPLPYFASREDLFEPGFLAALLAHWPRPLPALLARVPLRWLFRMVRLRPIRRVREFSLGEALCACAREAVASGALEGILNPRGHREISACLGALPARLDALLAESRLAGLRGAPWGLRRLSRSARNALAPGFRAAIASQLASFAALLDAGRIVYLSAEGGTSDSGAFGRVRAGAWRICRLAASTPAILPVALSYDPFRAGRLRVIVRIGRPLRGIDQFERRRFDAMIRRAILENYAVTPSHLASRYLAAGPARFTAREFCNWLQRAAAGAAQAGITVDPLLAGGGFESVAASRLAWLARHRLIASDGTAWLNRCPADVVPGWRSVAGMVRYLDNALGDLASEFPRSAAHLQP